MKPEVERAIAQVRVTWPDCKVDVKEDGSGGAHVRVNDVPLGPPYAQPFSWFTFHITFQYPYADVYPHFVRPDLSRTDGKPLGDATSPGTTPYDGTAGIQLSRRNNRLNPARDTAAAKLIKVIEWLKSRP